MSALKILVTRAWPKEAEERLVAEALGDVTLRDPDTPMSHDEFMAAADTYDVIMPTYEGQVSEEGLLQLIAYIRSLGADATSQEPAGAGGGGSGQ